MAMRIPDYPAVDTTEIPDTQFVKKGMLTQEEYKRCGVCGYMYPESEFTYFEGKRYCHQHRCFEDIADIVETRIVERNIPREDRERSDR